MTLRSVLASLAVGDSLDYILTDFPSPKPEDIKAAQVDRPDGGSAKRGMYTLLPTT